MLNVPHRPICFNIQSPDGDTVQGDYKAFNSGTGMWGIGTPEFYSSAVLPVRSLLPDYRCLMPLLGLPFPT